MEAEVFAIPNYLVVSIITEDGQPITRMRRIGHHGNDLDAVEKFSGLSRAFCNRKPDPNEGRKWLDLVRSKRQYYSVPVQFAGNFLGAFGYGLFFGGNFLDSLCAGVCGLLIGVVDMLLNARKANPFFRTIAASAVSALPALILGDLPGLHPDAVIAGAYMSLLPGLAFTTALRDIMAGDMLSGLTKAAEGILIAVAIVLGAGAAMGLVRMLAGG